MHRRVGIALAILFVGYAVPTAAQEQPPASASTMDEAANPDAELSDAVQRDQEDSDAVADEPPDPDGTSADDEADTEDAATGADDEAALAAELAAELGGGDASDRKSVV